MAKLINVIMTALVVVMWVGSGGAAQVHHVVGGDRGWDVSSDIASWSSARNFRVGDLIWFGYAAPHENVVELQNMEEYISCDVANPIRMLTNGLDKISLVEEGIRYFASGNPESCNNGLKLHVEVQSQDKNEITTVQSSSSNSSTDVAATGPTPSVSAHVNEVSYLLWIGACFTFLYGL